MEKIVATATERQTLGDGKVRVSLTLPTLPPKAKTPLAKSFEGYYGGMRKGFLRYAGGSLLSRSEGAAAPYGAVLRAVISNESAKTVSVYVDAVVSTDDARTVTRLPQLWSKENGTLINVKSLYEKRSRARLLPLLEEGAAARAESAGVSLFSDWRTVLRRRADRSAFYVSPAGLVFIYGAGVLSDRNEIFPVHINKEKLVGILAPTSFEMLWDV